MTNPLNRFNIKGRRALVTGASSGLGLHFARLLAAMDAHVTLAARRRDRLNAACAALRKDGKTAEAVTLDISDQAGIQVLFGTTDPFDIVVNNAGISRPGALIDLPPQDWHDVVETNLNGAFFVAQQAAAAMRDAQKGGAIVNIASILGVRVSGGVGAYTAAKAGLVQMTRAMALEWARYGIRVNALCPGYIATDMNRAFFASDHGKAQIKRVPQRRLGEPDDLDGALLLLASDAGRFITGADLAVDGGHLVSGL